MYFLAFSSAELVFEWFVGMYHGFFRSYIYANADDQWYWVVKGCKKLITRTRMTMLNMFMNCFGFGHDLFYQEANEMNVWRNTKRLTWQPQSGAGVVWGRGGGAHCSATEWHGITATYLNQEALQPHRLQIPSSKRTRSLDNLNLPGCARPQKRKQIENKPW